MVEEGDINIANNLNKLPKTPQLSITENTKEIEDAEHSTWSKYEMFFFIISYTVMFLSRLGKDLFKFVLDYFHSEQKIPEHILDLTQTSKKLHLENNLRKATWIRYYKQQKCDLSESLLDVHIPSFPGSPRSLNIGSESSIQSHEHNSFFAEAINFLHEDREFLIAAETGNHTVLEILIRQKVNIQQKDHLGRNALHLAVCSDSEAAVKLLLKSKINVNVKDNLGMTPLSLCLMRRPSYKIANLLFDHGAEIAPRSNIVDTGLFLQFVMMCEPTEEDVKILQLLVAKGATVNDPDAPGGRQALHFAAMSNNCKLIRILIDLGADPNLENHRKETPKEVAEIFKCKEAYELLADLEEEDLLETESTL